MQKGVHANNRTGFQPLTLQKVSARREARTPARTAGSHVVTQTSEISTWLIDEMRKMPGPAKNWKRMARSDEQP